MPVNLTKEYKAGRRESSADNPESAVREVRHHWEGFCENFRHRGEMNPLVFSALEEVNLVFTLMVSSTVMVDIVFACFMFCTFYWR